MIGLFCTILAVYFFWTDGQKHFSVLLILFLVTGGFQLIPNDLFILPQLGLQRTYDWLLIFCFLIFLIKPTIFINADLWSSNKYLKYFGLYLVLLLLFNSIYLNVALGTSTKVFRSYIYFIVVFPFVMIEKEDYLKIFQH